MDSDLPPDPIELSRNEREALETAIPFHHPADEQEPVRPVSSGVPPLHPAKRKWHEDHDAVLENGGHDRDILLVRIPSEKTKTKLPL